MVETPIPTYESLEIGDAAPQLEFGPVTLNMILRYAGASGDFNPLHNDADFAKAAGYPGIFAMGMMSAAWLGRMLTDWVGPQSIRRYKVRFVNQVWPGDRLTCSGRVSDKREAAEGRLVDLELAVTNQKGETVLQGSATAALQ
jgi:acyl dehydratase